MAREFQKRDKKAHKMTRDGLVERNLATGEEQCVSLRGQDFELRAAQTPGGTTSGEARQTESFRHTGSVRQAIADYNGRDRSGHTSRQSAPTDTMRDTGPAAETQTSGGTDNAFTAQPLQSTEAPARDAPGASPISGNSRRDAGFPADHEPRRSDRRGGDSGGRYSEDAARPAEPLSHHETPEYYPGAEPPDTHRPADSRQDTGSDPRGGVRPGRLRFDDASKTAPSGSKARQHGTQYQRKFNGDTTKADGTTPAPESAPVSDTPHPADSHPDAGHKPRGSEHHGRLRFGGAEKTTLGDSKAHQHGTWYQRKFTEDTGKGKTSDSGAASPDGTRTSDESRPAGSPDSGSGSERSESSGAARKKSRLEFSKDEQPPGADTPDKKVENARQKAEKSAAKLEKAREKLPTRRRARLNKEFDPEKGKAVRKLRFEEEVKPQRAHVKGPLPLRPVKAGANVGIGYVHKKIYQVQDENVGVEAAHKGELAVEGGLRRVYHMNKTRPYRRVRKLQKKATKRAVNHAYQKALAENPKLKSNILSRMAQKRKIKRQYAKAAREAQRTGRAIKKTAVTTEKIAKAIAGLIRRHPVVFGILALILLLMFLIMGFFSSCSNMAAGGLSSIVASSYLAEDADIDNAELSYTEWETDLQLEVMNAEATHPGFDEYRYSVDDIGHNPYELMAFLTAAYQDFTYSGVQAVLQEIFAEQYTLSFVEEVEVRYRTETHTDPETGESYDVEVPYNWYILNINLTARSFSEVIAPRLNSDQQEIFELLMTTKGNRQYLTNPFDFNWLPYVSSYYGWRVHPISGAKDYHKGIDIAVAEGTEIRAGHDGRVTSAGNAGDYGLVVVLDDGKGLVSKYAHCSELLVSSGQEVKKGDVIAKVGNTGNSTGPHLHLEIIKNGQYLNPAYFAETGDDGTGSLPPGSPGGPVIPDYPGAPMGDGSFAALMEEAQKHLGKQYVFGASGPNTFDCSGFVSYVLNHSGVANVGRKSAQGLYNITTPVSRENAQPGDLIFFQGTYSTSSTVTHIGIYIGNGQMIHAGKPVQYASIDTNYWTDHFYAFGRLP